MKKMSMRIGIPVFYLLWSLCLSGFLLSSCNQQSAGFALPAGDESEGKISFVGLNCNTCHSIADIAWEGINGKDLHFPLGGEVTRVKTYGELVTSVINPSHKIARNFRMQQGEEIQESPMENYNELMTVQQLVDIVTFLQEQYHVAPPPGNYFPY